MQFPWITYAGETVIPSGMVFCSMGITWTVSFLIAQASSAGKDLLLEQYHLYAVPTYVLHAWKHPTHCMMSIGYAHESMK